MSDMAKQLGWSVACIRDAISEQYRVPTDRVRIPSLAYVLGSAQGELVGRLDRNMPHFIVPYDRIFGFPQSTVPGHEGVLHVGYLGGAWTVLLAGRAHFYEGNEPDQVVHATRTMLHWGVKTMVFTNAAGSVTDSFKSGDIMVIRDHVDWFSGVRVCRGPVDPVTRTTPFPPPVGVHKNWLRELALQVCRDLHFEGHFGDGIYAMLPGPFYETGAEVNLFRALNCATDHEVVHALGMSTVPEVRAALAMGCREIVGISLITNPAGVSGLDHDAIMASIAPGRERTVKLLEEMAVRIHRARKICEAGAL